MKIIDPSVDPQGAAQQTRELVSLLEKAIAAADGAQVVIETCFEQQGRDPSNNDNYCRLRDWLKAARPFLS